MYFLLSFIAIGLLYETAKTAAVRTIARLLFILLVVAFVMVLILAGSGVAHTEPRPNLWDQSVSVPSEAQCVQGIESELVIRSVNEPSGHSRR